MTKTKKFVVTAIVIAVVLVVFYMFFYKNSNSPLESGSYNFTASQEVLYNPVMGFAAEADYEENVLDNTLVYVDIMWSELEPQEGVYAFDKIEEDNNLKAWREAGKHVVLRFMCDKPSKDKHMDIPQWLYNKIGGDGAFYDYSEHRGFSPNYNNQILIEKHARAIEALGKHFGKDTFVSYVELGSLGHWGEWHVNYESGIPRIPSEDIREKYIAPYISAFPNAKMLMRRPFKAAAKNGFGVYDDMAGHPESSGEWLQWIEKGGDYSQAKEKNALQPMPSAWKRAPIGGEFTSDLSMDWMLRFNLEQTLSLLARSHTTFLGPKFPDKGQSGSDDVLKKIGYRLRISKMSINYPLFGASCAVKLSWTNDGIAPMYWDLPVNLYLLDSNDEIIKALPIDLKTSTVLPGETVTSNTAINWIDAYSKASRLCVGIVDPMTNKPAVSLAMNAEKVGAMTVLYKFKKG
ncbi:MAG: DUF4832 domain-containing protein [Clostridia bacterium]